MEAKKMVFEKVPEAIQVFEEIDETYFIYSDMADSIVARIEDHEFINKIIELLEIIINRREEILETLIVIQVFQKIYPVERVDILFSQLIEERGRIYCIYLKYKLKYLEDFT